MITDVDPVFALIDVASMRGIEIGPLASPRVSKEDGPIKYLDHADTATLRRKYADNVVMGPKLDEIVEVDYALDGRSIREAVGGDAPFDYVLASHVIEHIPDPIGWMVDISSVLRMGGILSMVVPDKRYSFDVNRGLTGMGDFVDAYLSGRTRPTIRDIYNFHSQIATSEGYVDTAGLWAGTADYEGVVRTDVDDPDAEALRICRGVVQSDEFVDVHCHVFTPTSFVSLFGALSRLGLSDFDVASWCPTQPNTLEFFVSLRKVRTTSSAPGPPEDEAFSRNDLSAKEWALIQAKRRVMRRVRRVWRPG